MKTASRERQKRGGFTLIELLVVIAIIAALAGLLLPGLARAKAIAHATKCKSNLRQMAAALTMYVGDSQGEYPLSGFWKEALALNLVDVTGTGQPGDGMLCPTWKGVEWITNGSGTLGGQLSYFRGSAYGYNGRGYDPQAEADVAVGLGGSFATLFTAGGDGFLNNKLPQPTRETQIVNSADMIALGDGYARSVLRGETGEDDLVSSATLLRGSGFAQLFPSRDSDFPKRRHRGRLNMAFADGHVEDGTVRQWYFSEEEKNLRRWRTDNEAE